MKKIKIASTLLVATCICGGFLFLNTTPTLTTVTTAPIVEEETTRVENIPSEDVVPPNNVEVNPEQETEAIFEESPISNN